MNDQRGKCTSLICVKVVFDLYWLTAWFFVLASALHYMKYDTTETDGQNDEETSM